MAVGAAQVDELVTRVTLQGAETVQRGQLALATGWRQVASRTELARKSLDAMKATSTQMMIAGAGVTAVGVGMLAYMRNAAVAAGAQEAAETRLATGLKASGAGGEAAAKSIAAYAGALQRTTPAADEASISGAAMLASFKMNEEQIRAYLPRLIDMQAGLKKVTGQERSLEDIAIMVGKAHMGQISALRRVGIMVDATAYKQNRMGAILAEIDKEFGGQGAAALGTYAGASAQLANLMGDVQESMSQGMLPTLTALTRAASWGAAAVVKFNEATHGAAGIVVVAVGGITALAGGTLLLVGALARAVISVQELALKWREVQAAATGAAGAQGAAALAGQAAGAGGGGLPMLGGIGGRLRGGVGRLKGFAKGAGVSLGLGIAGGIVGGYGDRALAEYNKSGGRRGGVGAVAGGIGGSALSGAGIGAMVGSIIPGLGTAIGAAIGGAGGAIYGAVKTARGRHPEAVATPADTVAASSNRHLKRIADLMDKQTRVIVGGGERAKGLLNEGDLQRMLYGQLSRAIV